MFVTKLLVMPSRTLLIRPGGIGDCILTLPAMEWLATEYTEVWVPWAVVPLIRFASRVRSIASTGLDLLGLPGIGPEPDLIATLQSFEAIFSWYGARRPELHSAARALGLAVRFLPALPDPTGPLHAADFFAAQVGAPVGARPHIDCGPVTPGDFAMIHPFSGSARKNWPLERYRSLAAALPVRVEWCAGPDEPLENAVRMEDLYQLGCHIASARLYIGNDSGITHLAAACGASVVALFGPTDPRVWGPRGERVAILQADLDRIAIEDVLRAARPYTGLRFNA